jgi:hypothetical protein
MRGKSRFFEPPFPGTNLVKNVCNCKHILCRGLAFMAKAYYILFVRRLFAPGGASVGVRSKRLVSTEANCSGKKEPGVRSHLAVTRYPIRRTTHAVPLLHFSANQSPDPIGDPHR